MPGRFCCDASELSDGGGPKNVGGLSGDLVVCTVGGVNCRGGRFVDTVPLACGASTVGAGKVPGFVTPTFATPTFGCWPEAAGLFCIPLEAPPAGG